LSKFLLRTGQPFFGIKNGTNQDAASRWLELIDGGSNLENVPMGPMLVKARGVDVLVAVDGSADDENSWPK
jgi:lysophospholipase